MSVLKGRVSSGHHQFAFLNNLGQKRSFNMPDQATPDVASQRQGDCGQVLSSVKGFRAYTSRRALAAPSRRWLCSDARLRGSWASDDATQHLRRVGYETGDRYRSRKPSLRKCRFEVSDTIGNTISKRLPWPGQSKALARCTHRCVPGRTPARGQRQCLLEAWRHRDRHVHTALKYQSGAQRRCRYRCRCHCHSLAHTWRCRPARRQRRRCPPHGYITSVVQHIGD